MDQEKRTTGAVITAVIMFFCAFIFLCLGAGMAFSYPDKVWTWGVVLLACCAIMVYSGISNIRLSKNIENDSITQLRNTAGEPVNIAPGETITPQADAINVLARWRYSKEEWQAFLNAEKKERKSNSIIEATVLVIIGTISLHFLRDTSWMVAFCVGSAIGVIYWVGKYFLSMGSIGRAANNEVIVTNRSVIINGKVNTFRDGQYSLQGVRLRETTSPATIEFVYSWQTRNPNVPAHDEIRIPVPQGKLSEAIALVKQF
jgi:hypothetical protein